MRATLALALALVVAPAGAAAYLAVEPLREVLAHAGPDVRACVVAHELPAGRYVVRLVVGRAGRVESTELSESPAPLDAPATECLLAAFSVLRFPSMAAAPAAPPERVWVHGRRSRVPLPRSARPSGGDTVVISWPFVVAS